MIAQTRKELRADLRRFRRELIQRDPSLVRNLANEIATWLAKRSFRSIGFYWPQGTEPDVVWVVRDWLEEEEGRIAALPVVEGDSEGRMHYARWEPGATLQKNRFGILEPISAQILEPEIILAPCLGFTQTGFRLGSGGGFFDRYLASRIEQGTRPMTVIVAFEGQLCEVFEPEPQDVAFDWIATENGARRAS